MKTKSFVLIFFLMLSMTAFSQELKTAFEGKLGEIPFIVTTPKGYSSKEIYPTIIFLHGGDGSNTKHHPAKYALKSGIDFPFIVIAPSCKGSCSWANVDLSGILNYVGQEFSIDKNRVYLTGYSMGGTGTWANLKKIAPLLAAASPLAPAGGSIKDICLAIEVPTRVYHGTADYGYENSKKMINALNKCGEEKAELISLKGKGHGIWPAIFSDASFYLWLLTHSKK